MTEYIRNTLVFLFMQIVFIRYVIFVCFHELGDWRHETDSVALCRGVCWEFGQDSSRHSLTQSSKHITAENNLTFTFLRCVFSEAFLL